MTLIPLQCPRCRSEKVGKYGKNNGSGIRAIARCLEISKDTVPLETKK